MTCLKVSQQAWLIKSNVEIKCRQTDQIKELLSQIKEMPQLSVRQKYCVCLSYVGHPQSKKCGYLDTCCFQESLGFYTGTRSLLACEVWTNKFLGSFLGVSFVPKRCLNVYSTPITELYLNSEMTPEKINGQRKDVVVSNWPISLVSVLYKKVLSSFVWRAIAFNRLNTRN